MADEPDARRFVLGDDDVIAWTFRLPGVGYVENGVQHYERENPQGSVVSTIDESGAISNRAFYDAYGQEGASPAGARSRYGFNGYHGYAEDGASPLVLCGARLYLPQLGRFLTPDPIGHDGGMNLYEYCDDNPVAKSDPSGKLSIMSFFAAAQQIPFFHSYGGEDEAVAAMSTFIWPTSWAQHREYGGFISKMSDDRYRLRGLYTAPTDTYYGTADVPGRSFEATAYWHTHPFTAGMPIPNSFFVSGDSDVFSRVGTAANRVSGDIPFFVRAQHVNGYLISPNLIRRFDLATGDESHVPYRNKSGVLEKWKPS